MFEIKPKFDPIADPKLDSKGAALPNQGKDDLLKSLGADAVIPALSSSNPVSLAAQGTDAQAPYQVTLSAGGRNITYSTHPAGQGVENAAISDTSSVAGVTLQSSRFSQYSSEPEAVNAKGYLEKAFNNEKSFALNGRTVTISQTEPEPV